VTIFVCRLGVVNHNYGHEFVISSELKTRDYSLHQTCRGKISCNQSTISRCFSLEYIIGPLKAIRYHSLGPRREYLTLPRNRSIIRQISLVIFPNCRYACATTMAWLPNQILEAKGVQEERSHHFPQYVCSSHWR